MKINKEYLKSLITNELNKILSEQMAGGADSGSTIDTARTIMTDAVNVVKGQDPALGEKLDNLMKELLEAGHI